MNYSLKYMIYILFFSFIYCQTNQSITSTPSIIPFQLTPISKPMLHLGGVEEENGHRIISGLQFQPTKNLIIGGVLSPRKNEEDISIYYHIALGYIPKWKLFNFSSNMLQIGMHRNRFGEEEDKRWFSFSVLESSQYGKLNLNLCWNRLFTKNQEKNTMLISTDIKINNNFYLRPGAIAYFKPDFKYFPFLFVSITL